jgi:hypothetical protein
MTMPRNTIINAMAAIAAIALPATAHAETIDLDCTATLVVDRKEYVNRDTFFAAARDIKPEYRRITYSIERGSRTDGSLTYGVGGNDPKNWTLPVIKVEDGKDGGFIAEIKRDNLGYGRWLYVKGEGFVTIVTFPDGTKSAAGGYCKIAPGQELPPKQELRDPGQPSVKTGPKSWQVPIERHGGGIELDGMLNDSVPIRWALDTGASITNIPYDVAVNLDAKVVREAKFENADGTVATNQIVLIKKLSIGDKVYATDIEASVTAKGTTPLLGRNFLEYFSSYEIDNAQSQLTLRQ